MFALITIAPVALAAWAVGISHLAIRAAFFGRTVKRDFYHSAYMHYITPEALYAYQVFIEQLDDMNNIELQEQAALGKAIPYMHRQAVQRKMGERGILEGREFELGAHIANKVIESSQKAPQEDKRTPDR